MEILQFISNNSIIFTILGVIAGIIGWVWAAFQFFSNREHIKKDKIFEKRHEAYTSYINKKNEIANKSLKNSINLLDFVKEFFSGNTQEIDFRLNTFPLFLIEKYKDVNLLYTSIYTELDNLLLICSDELSPLIEELKQALQDSQHEQKIQLNKIVQIDMKNIQPADYSIIMECFEDKESKDSRNIEKEILAIMRKELSYYNKK